MTVDEALDITTRRLAVVAADRAWREPRRAVSMRDRTTLALADRLTDVDEPVLRRLYADAITMVGALEDDEFEGRLAEWRAEQ